MNKITDLIHHSYQAPAGFASPQPGVFKASTVIFPNVAAMRARDWQQKKGYTYGLHGTPTTFMLEERIAALCEPYERQVAQLDTIPGFGVTTAQDLIAETGTAMSAFPTAGHLCSWARLTPRVTESAGKRKGKNATGRGNPYIGGALGEASAGAARTQTFLAAKYRRLCRHMPKKKAQVAVMRTQLSAAHALLSDPGASYQDLGPSYYEQQADARRSTRGHVRSLERLGWKVTLEPVDPDTGEVTAPASS